MTLNHSTWWKGFLACGLAVALAGLAPATLHAQTQPVRAPEFDGATGFIGTDRALKLADLRGKFVVLDFWTLC